MGGDLVIQKNRETIALNEKSFSLLALAWGCGLAEHVKIVGFRVRRVQLVPLTLNVWP